MKISTREGSEYFRGLLLLIGKDRVITDPEVTLMHRVGKALGFNGQFTTEAIGTILDNSYIPSEPPKFSSVELTKRFIRDGLAIARSDDGIHTFEADWLRAVALQNGLDVGWFEMEKESAMKRPRDLGASLEADSISVGTGS